MMLVVQVQRYGQFPIPSPPQWLIFVKELSYNRTPTCTHAYEPLYGVIFALCEDFFPWVDNYTRIGIERPREDFVNHPVTDTLSVSYT